MFHGFSIFFFFFMLSPMKKKNALEIYCVTARFHQKCTAFFFFFVTFNLPDYVGVIAD